MQLSLIWEDQPSSLYGSGEILVSPSTSLRCKVYLSMDCCIVVLVHAAGIMPRPEHVEPCGCLKGHRRWAEGGDG